MAPARLFHNGLIFTAPPAELEREALADEAHRYHDPASMPGRFAECLLVADGLIRHVGPLSDLPPDADPVERVDLNGQLVVPGFIDAHTHLLMFGQSLDKVDLTHCTNLQDIQQTLRDAAAANPHAKRILAQCWLQNMTNNVALASDIDAVLPHIPVYIAAKDLHSSWLNTAALREIGITDHTPDPDGGLIERDEHGHASGLLTEMANINIVWPALAQMASEHERDADLLRACDAYLASGYTGVVDMALDQAALESIRRVKASRGGTLPIRVAAHWLITPHEDEQVRFEQVRTAIRLSEQESDEWFRVVGIKLVCDGVIDACTAAIKQPYANGQRPGPIWPLDAMLPVIRMADDAGLQLALHAIGDQAVHIAVEAIATLGEQRGLSIRDRRHRIEHLELTDPADVARLGALGITASVQPVHSDPAILHGWCAMLGDDLNHGRSARAFAYRDFIHAGAPLALGTDAPTAAHLVLPNIYNAVTRRSTRDPTSTLQTTPHFALPLATALAAASHGAAHSCFADSYAGSLHTGKSADFVIINTDLFAHAHDPDSDVLLTAAVQQTWIKGDLVFQR